MKEIILENNMKEIILENNIIYYNEDAYFTQFGDSYTTYFYIQNGFKKITKWSWRKFKYIETDDLEPNYECFLQLNYFISKNTDISKKELHSLILSKLDIHKRRKERELELENNIII